MRHRTIKQFDAAVQAWCNNCRGDAPAGYCPQAGCTWRDDFIAISDRAEALSLFTYAGFLAECRMYLTTHRGDMLAEMWWSDIRHAITEHLRETKTAQPNPRWWSAVAQQLLPACGWMRTEITRVSPINRARENLYMR